MTRIRILTPEQKAAKAAYTRRWSAIPERKAARAKYDRHRQAKPEVKAAKAEADRRRRATPEWRAASATPEYKAAMAAGRRRRGYGLTSEAYEAMLSAQDGRCAICILLMDEPTVDHCHKTGDVRGLLCRTCNRAIGLLGDDPAVLDAAANYLRDWIPA